MKAILGCYHTTPTAAMEIETGLPPTWLRLQTKVLLSATRLQSLSARHPIQAWVEEACRTSTAAIKHRSTLGNIYNQFPFTTARIESIEPYVRAPWWTTQAVIQVAECKETAKTLHDNRAIDNDTMIIYTDGSGIDERIGAAAFNMSTSQISHQHLGRQTQFNVYGAELTAINLGITQWIDHRSAYPNCHIFTDSQAACASIEKPKRQSGQAIIAAILNQIDSVTNSGSQMKITWIPGHMEIEGNERADAEAKHAATTPTASKAFQYPPLKSCWAQKIKTIAKEQWNKAWLTKTQTAHHLRRISTKQGIKTGPKLYNNISSRATCAQVVQLRTGHCGLNKYLHRFKKRDSPTCECGYGEETVEHFLLECPNYKEARKELRRKVGTRKMKVASLLGDAKTVELTMEYVKATKRMGK
jgi:ribonuclease HI